MRNRNLCQNGQFGCILCYIVAYMSYFQLNINIFQASHDLILAVFHPTIPSLNNTGIQNCISYPKEPSCLQASGGGQSHSSPFSDAIPELGALCKTEKHPGQVSVCLLFELVNCETALPHTDTDDTSTPQLPAAERFPVRGDHADPRAVHAAVTAP